MRINSSGRRLKIPRVDDEVVSEVDSRNGASSFRSFVRIRTLSNSILWYVQALIIVSPSSPTFVLAAIVVAFNNGGCLMMKPEVTLK
jgi:hypothetical protein